MDSAAEASPAGAAISDKRNRVRVFTCSFLAEDMECVLAVCKGSTAICILSAYACGWFLVLDLGKKEERRTRDTQLNRAREPECTHVRRHKQANLVCHSHLTLIKDTLDGHSGVTLFPDNFVRRHCLTRFCQHSYRTPVSRNLVVAHSCRTPLGNTFA